ncbi:acyl-CoA thioesterase [Natronospirillum operosum]|uniref:Acyl-CoA thioesterase n=1 Tax=Natronospirillum operosum TaxID=2759953 RepID=A0A4Z0WFV1_9GAMM|nr:thioesterase family protein [Natronospirillum operosum]TGG93370.1 acyl-CoA thioesterase [Natronospirillum operosum]
MTFQASRRVRFAHCDPAAIVFFPRYFEMINSVVEDWFSDVIGLDFNRMHQQLGVGVPTASLQTDFTAPSRLGEVLVFSLTPQEVGRTSLQLIIEAHCAGELRLRNRSTLVYVDMTTGRPIAWPDDLRQQFTQLLED